MFIKSLVQNLHHIKNQMKPDEYYKLLEKVLMVVNAEYYDKPEEIEHAEEPQIEEPAHTEESQIEEI